MLPRQRKWLATGAAAAAITAVVLLAPSFFGIDAPSASSAPNPAAWVAGGTVALSPDSTPDAG
jgi:hypothetical protein